MLRKSQEKLHKALDEVTDLTQSVTAAVALRPISEVYVVGIMPRVCGMLYARTDH